MLAGPRWHLAFFVIMFVPESVVAAIGQGGREPVREIFTPPLLNRLPAIVFVPWP